MGAFESVVSHGLTVGMVDGAKFGNPLVSWPWALASGESKQSHSCNGGWKSAVTWRIGGLLLAAAHFTIPLSTRRFLTALYAPRPPRYSIGRVRTFRFHPSWSPRHPSPPCPTPPPALSTSTASSSTTDLTARWRSTSATCHFWTRLTGGGK